MSRGLNTEDLEGPEEKGYGQSTSDFRDDVEPFPGPTLRHCSPSGRRRDEG